jgi:hypothetical protein
MESVTQVRSATDDTGGADLLKKRQEIVRLALIGGCIATAALADLEGSALPWSKIVAVGAALLGGLLALRRPQRTAEKEEPVGEYVAPKPPRRIGRRRAHQTERRLDVALGRIEALDKHVAELSRRQTVLRVMARDGLGVVEQRLDVLEAAVKETDERTRQEAERLQNLLAGLAERLLDVTATKRSL